MKSGVPGKGRAVPACRPVGGRCARRPPAGLALVVLAGLLWLAGAAAHGGESAPFPDASPPAGVAGRPLASGETASDEPAPDEDAPDDAPAEESPGEEAPAEGVPVADAAAAPCGPAPAPAFAEVRYAARPAPFTLWRKPLHGSLRLRYRMRTTGDEQDHDLYQYLQLTWGDEEAPGLSGAFHGRLSEDLDGNVDPTGFYVFDSVTDTFGDRVTGRVYHAWVNYRPCGGRVEQVRVGRQYVEGGEFVHLDGVRVDLRPLPGRHRVRAGGFVGVPAHLFESSPAGDFAIGAHVEASLWQGGDTRLDVMHLQDDTGYYGGLENTLVTLTHRQRLGRVLGMSAVGFRGSFQMLDDEPRTLALAADAVAPYTDLTVRAAFDALLTRQNERVTELDPYYVIALQLEPYWNGVVSVAKGLGRYLVAEGGVAVRRLFDASDEGRFNRNFERWFVAVSTDDWPCRDWHLTATGERWRSADDAWSVGFEAEHRPSRRWRLRLGTDYALYKFDFYTADERQSVRGYYARATWRPNDTWTFDARLRVETDAFDTYVTLITGAEFEF